VLQLIVNVLGTLVAGLCAVLLLRAYSSVRKRLLLWAGLCFAGLAASNALVVADLFVVPEIDLYRSRLAVAAAAMLLLVYGLIFESDRS
jgi:fluoride ion exporter CrcB/FEX